MMTSVTARPRDCSQTAGRSGGLSHPSDSMRLFPGRKSFCLRFAERPLAGRSARCFDACRPFNPIRGWRQLGVNESAGQAIDAEGQLRGMLLSLQSPLRPGPARAVRDVQAQRGSAAPATAVALRLSPGAAHARCLGIPLRSGAGRAARVVAAAHVGSLLSRYPARAPRRVRCAWRSSSPPACR